MNVLHLIESSEPGGAETILLATAKGLKDKGHRSVIGLLEPGWLSDELQRHGFPTIIVRQNTSYDVGCLWALTKIVKRFKIDVIHSHEFAMNAYGSLAGLYQRVPVVSTVHGKNYYWLKRRRRFAYRLVSRLTTMVAVCEDIKNLLVRRVGISRNRITTVYNGIDIAQFDRVPDGTAIAKMKRDLSIPGTSPVIGTVGMLIPEKDHKTFLKAAQSVIGKRPDAVFLIAGTGQLEHSLKAGVVQAGLSNNVRFTGFRDDVGALLHIMDVYVCSSLSEGLSLSILEAMAAARPVVATNVGGNPEVVANKKTGLLVPPSDPTALASRINLLLKNKHLAREISLNAQRVVHQRFSLRQMVESYEELYRVARGRRERKLVATAPFA